MLLYQRTQFLKELERLLSTREFLPGACLSSDKENFTQFWQSKDETKPSIQAPVQVKILLGKEGKESVPLSLTLFQSLASHKRLSVHSKSINTTISQRSTETWILRQYRIQTSIPLSVPFCSLCTTLGFRQRYENTYQVERKGTYRVSTASDLKDTYTVTFSRTFHAHTPIYRNSRHEHQSNFVAWQLLHQNQSEEMLQLHQSQLD